MKTKMFAIATMLAVPLTAMLAQEPSAPPPPAPTSAPMAEDLAAMEGTGVTAEKGKDTLSVDFPNAEIRTILRNIADLFDLNLVIPETLEGRASLKLRDVTWKQIFDVLLSPVGYTYVTQDNIIKIVSIESLNVEPAETRIFILNYARASEIAPTVSTMVDQSKGGRMQVETRSNALVVTERPKRLEKIDEVIERLDRATDQVMIETKFVEITNRDLNNLGVNWASLSEYKLGADPTDLLVRGGSPGGRNIEGTLVSTATDASSAFGAVFTAPEFNLVLSALETSTESRLISNPTVVTMNNNEALISIGKQFPIPNYTYNQERGTFEVSGFEYKDIGIILKVTPQVNAAGMITLKIDPEVSSQEGETTFGGASGANIPIIATRRTSTQVAIKDGYTMGLGGLIENTSIDSTSGVPVLRDIPGLGSLFRSKGKNANQRNLVVFITAKILSPSGATYKEVFPASVLEAVGVSDADFQHGR
jgi:type IV pilus assembly protein PilQ